MVMWLVGEVQYSASATLTSSPSSTNILCQREQVKQTWKRLPFRRENSDADILKGKWIPLCCRLCEKFQQTTASKTTPPNQLGVWAVACLGQRSAPSSCEDFRPGLYGSFAAECLTRTVCRFEVANPPADYVLKENTSFTQVSPCECLGIFLPQNHLNLWIAVCSGTLRLDQRLWTTCLWHCHHRFQFSSQALLSGLAKIIRWHGGYWWIMAPRCTKAPCWSACIFISSQIHASSPEIPITTWLAD